MHLVIETKKLLNSDLPYLTDCGGVTCFVFFVQNQSASPWLYFYFVRCLPCDLKLLFVFLYNWQYNKANKQYQQCPNQPAFKS